MAKKILVHGVMAVSLLAQSLAWGQSAPKVERPPQFVLLAFDGSYNNDVWKYSRDYTQFKKGKGIDTRFTFFINPVYLISPENKSVYKAPGGNKGSAIGWGDNNQDVSERIDQMNEAYREGHEIGSHTVGHFNGSTWSKADWDSEFKQFDYVIENLFSINKLNRTAKGYDSLLFTKDIIGFRAPQLGYNDSMYQTLSDFGFKYDTSQQSKDENYWPRKNALGTWNFPLARIKEPGTARAWVSMDYNFCVRDSAALLAEKPETFALKAYDAKKGKTLVNKGKDCLNVVNAEQKAQVKKNMMNLYRTYFEKNYYGNRAPVHIGHHFSSWMSGAYLETFFEFANEVCSLPEVKCVTYAELMKFMDLKSTAEINALQAGQFEKLPRPKSLTMLARHLDLHVNLVKGDKAIRVALTGKDAKMEGLTKWVSFGGHSQKLNHSIKLTDLRSQVSAGQDVFVRVSVKDDLDAEIATATYKVEKVGTSAEKVGTENIEESWLEGHLEAADHNESDTLGH